MSRNPAVSAACIVLTVLVLGSVLAGCTTPSDYPTPAQPSSPGRPVTVRLDGRDPCTLLTRADQAAFGISHPGTLTTELARR